MEEDIKSLQEQVEHLTTEVAASRWFIRTLLMSEVLRTPPMLDLLKHVGAGKMGEVMESDPYSLPPNLSDEAKAALEAASEKGRKNIQAAIVEMARAYAIQIEMMMANRR